MKHLHIIPQYMVVSQPRIFINDLKKTGAGLGLAIETVSAVNSLALQKLLTY